MAPRSLHPVAAVAGAADRLRDLALPIVIGAVVGGGRGGAGSALIYGLAGVGIALVAGVLHWRSERYWVDEAGVHYRHGILSRAETSIPRDRVQGIDTVRGPIQRLFGLVALDVQSAGGGREGGIRPSAGTRAAAAELRARLGLGEDRPPDALRRLGAGGVLVAALTSGRLGVLVPLLAAATQLLPDLGGTERGVSRLVPHDVAGGLALAAAVLAVAWALSVLGSVVAFAGFTVARDGERLRVRRGLLQRREASVPVARIDAVRIVENPLRQPLGLAELRLESAGYASEERAARTLFPLLRRRAIAGLLSDLLPEYSAVLDGLTPSPARARRRYVLPPVAVALAGAGLVVGLAGADGLAALALVPPATAFGLARHAAAGVRLDRASAVLRARRLARTTLLADARRLVRIERRDNVLTRRAGLAPLGVGVGSGTRLRVHHLDRGTADAHFAGLAALATGVETHDVHP